jgi:epoxyqueuosine reductase QueG
MRTVFGVGAQRRSTTHHGHRLATSCTGAGLDSGAERLSALHEVLSGALDLCSAMLASPSISTCTICQNTCCHIPRGWSDTCQPQLVRTLELRSEGIDVEAVHGRAGT